jgi:hypothetical protein
MMHPPTPEEDREADRRVEIDETLAEHVDELLRGERQSVHGLQLCELTEEPDVADEAVHILARIVASAGDARFSAICSAHSYIVRLRREACDRLRDKAYAAADDMAARERWEPKEPS